MCLTKLEVFLAEGAGKIRAAPIPFCDSTTHNRMRVWLGVYLQDSKHIFDKSGRVVLCHVVL